MSDLSMLALRQLYVLCSLEYHKDWLHKNDRIIPPTSTAPRFVIFWGQIGNKINLKEVLWARETEKPPQTFVFTKTAGHKTSLGPMLYSYYLQKYLIKVIFKCIL